jgi:hypothetical protein
MAQKPKTHCKYGHEMTPENTAVIQPIWNRYPSAWRSPRCYYQSLIYGREAGFRNRDRSAYEGNSHNRWCRIRRQSPAGRIGRNGRRRLYGRGHGSQAKSGDRYDEASPDLRSPTRRPKASGSVVGWSTRKLACLFSWLHSDSPSAARSPIRGALGCRPFAPAFSSLSYASSLPNRPQRVRGPGEPSSRAVQLQTAPLFWPSLGACQSPTDG